MKLSVYDTIIEERVYQRTKWGDARPLSVGDYLTLIDEYVSKAKSAFAAEVEPAAALHQLRKVAALCVACFERHGVPCR